MEKLLAILELARDKRLDWSGIQLRRVGPTVLLFQVLCRFNVRQRDVIRAGARHHVDQHVFTHALSTAAHDLIEHLVYGITVIKPKDVLHPLPEFANGALELVPSGSQLRVHQPLCVDSPEL